MKKAFTLIELLIVMGVIAILISIVIPAFRGMRENASLTRAEKDLQSLKVAIEFYYKRNGSYPTFSQFTSGVLTQEKGGLLIEMPVDHFGSLTYNSGGKIVRTLNYRNFQEEIPRFDFYAVVCAGPNRKINTYLVYNESDPFRESFLDVGLDDIAVSNLPIRKNQSYDIGAEAWFFADPYWHM